MLLADLGGSRLKLARADASSWDAVVERPWPAQPAPDDLSWVRAQRASAEEPVLLSTTRPAAVSALAELLGASLSVVEPDQVPLAKVTTGTGSDRLLAGLAAHRLADGACQVVDLGTAWTLDVIDATPCFLGGVIGPGLGVQTQALAQACPHLDAPGESTGLIPRSTAAAVRAGTLESLAAAIDSMAARYAAELDRAPARFLTGGDADALTPLLGAAWQRVDHLVLRGLAYMAQER